jgi:hypothetical protein
MADDPNEDDRPTVDAFADWLRPKQALALRGTLHDHGAVDILLTRLKAREIPAAAGLAKWFYDGENRDRAREPFPVQWWNRAKLDNAYDLFWTAPVSDLTVHPERGGGNPIYFLDVRFEPSAVRDAFGLPEPSLAVFPTGALQTTAQISRAPAPITPLRGGRNPAVSDTVISVPTLLTVGEVVAQHADVAPKATRAPNRNPDRKGVLGPRFVPDDKLTAWYEKYYADHPDDVYRIVRPRADKRFLPKFKVGKNQLYAIMSAVQNGLRAGKR